MMYSSAPELWKKLGDVSRCRGFRVYTRGGRRLLDLHLFGGAALLGHNPPLLLSAIKNTAERGVYGNLPAVQTTRLKKAVKNLAVSAGLGERKVYVYADKSGFEKALETLGFLGGVAGLADPVFGQRALDGIELWRPGSSLDQSLVPFLVPVLPAPPELKPYILLASSDSQLELDEQLPSALQSAVQGAGIVALQRQLPSLTVRCPEVRSALLEMKDVWTIDGPWFRLTSSTDEASWMTFVQNALDEGFILPPQPSIPLVFPGESSHGENSKLLAILRSFRAAKK